ncbi:TPA: LysR family transcriptional regulator [Klebsiella aerogenes]|nr:LysR family transcriptional regulator [Klebsiella aerogenes]
MDTSELYRIFLRVADNGSFIRTADALNRPASTISAAIRTLEDRLGTRLFHRTTRSVSLTADGHTFYTRCLDVLQILDDTENLFRRSAAQITGTLRVSVPGRVGHRIIIPALPDFLAHYPGIDVSCSITDRSVDLVEEGTDCVVRVGMPEASSLVARRIGWLTFINVASPAYLASYGIPSRPAELGTHFAVGYASPTTGRHEPWIWEDAGKTHQTDVPCRLVVNGAESCIAAAVAGVGMIQIPAYDVKNLLSDGKLQEVMPAFRPPPLPVSILYPHRRHHSHALNVFMDWVGPLLQMEMELLTSIS